MKAAKKAAAGRPSGSSGVGASDNAGGGAFEFAGLLAAEAGGGLVAVGGLFADPALGEALQLREHGGMEAGGVFQEGVDPLEDG